MFDDSDSSESGGGSEDSRINLSNRWSSASESDFGFELSACLASRRQAGGCCVACPWLLPLLWVSIPVVLLWLAWAMHVLEMHLVVKYIGVLLAFALYVVHGSGEVPPLALRILVSLGIGMLTIAIVSYPWWHHHSDPACAHFAGSQGNLEDCMFAVVFAAFAIWNTGSWHPKSSYTRKVVRCVSLIWLMNMGFQLAYTSRFCGGGLPVDLAKQCARAGAKVSNFWVQLLVVQRLIKLERSMGTAVRTGSMKCLLALYGIILLVEELGTVVVDELWDHGFWKLAKKAGHFVRSGILLALLCLYARAFAKPIRAISREFQKLPGVAKAEASWALGILHRELSVVVMTTLASSIMQGLSALSWIVKESFQVSIPHDIFRWMCFAEILIHIVGLTVLSGLACPAPVPSVQPPPRCSRQEVCGTSEGDPVWQAKVAELAGRGFAIGRLLDFVEVLLEGDVMPGFDPERSTTNDVVRGAIIPLSVDCPGAPGQGGGRALASVWSCGEATMAERMVTHAWDNIFTHLVAALVAENLGGGQGACCFDELLGDLATVEGVQALRQDISEHGRLEATYWVCAFSINQHASICGGFGPAPPEGTEERAVWERKKCDVFGRPFAVCRCREPKHFNNSPALCELNKFDDYMAFMQRAMPSFRQVVAVDRNFDLFTRAWCVAELVEADASDIPQAVLLHSSASLDQHYRKLASIDVRHCQASRREDRDGILAKIRDVDVFNIRLQWLTLGTEGLFKQWVDAENRASRVGRVAGRILAHAQT